MTSSGCGATPAGTRSLPRAPRWRPDLVSGQRVFCQALDALLAVALAPGCAACGDILESPLAGPVCPSCWSAVQPASQPVRGDGARPRGRRVPAARCATSSTRSSTRRRRSLTRPLARLMAEAARDVLHDAACVVPVPLHPWKRLTRGFNQAADLAAELGPPLVHALWRPRWARAQVGLPAAQRRRNVQGAFAASPWLRRAAACRLDHRPGGGAGGRCAHYRRHVVGVRAGADVDGCRRSATPDAGAGASPRRRSGRLAATGRSSRSSGARTRHPARPRRPAARSRVASSVVQSCSRA